MNILKALQSFEAKNPLVVIDPFKVHVDEAVEKARVLKDAGINILLLASTDYDSLTLKLPPYVDAIKQATDINIIINFPPNPQTGYAFLKKASATILSHILNSESTYYSSECFDLEEFKMEQNTNKPQNIITCAGLSFGADHKSQKWVAAIPTETSRESLGGLVSKIKLGGYNLVYLYSRFESVKLEVCSFFRENISPEQLLIVSGGFASRNMIDTYLKAGANYVVCGGVFEAKDWRQRMKELLY
jgi:heptaprenylglyceryl phosphate synthase